MFRFIRFAELPVTDQDRACAFYTGKLGFTVAEDAPYRDDWRWIELAIPGADTRALLTRRSSDIPGETPVLVLVADDVHTAFQRLSEAGVEFEQTPTQAPWNHSETYALFRDSERNLLMIGSSLPD